jgi:hypothetical protein
MGSVRVSPTNETVQEKARPFAASAVTDLALAAQFASGPSVGLPQELATLAPSTNAHLRSFKCGTVLASKALSMLSYAPAYQGLDDVRTRRGSSASDHG